MSTTNRTILSIAAAAIFLAVAGWAYWQFFMNPPSAPLSPASGTSQQGSGGFSPLQHGTGATGTNGNGTGAATTTTPGGATSSQSSKLPTLRLLSDAPVGGYAASTTASTTIVRWADRGRGNIYEASYDSSAILTLSNTLVPKIIQSVWNRDLTAFVASMFQDGDLDPTTVYAELATRAASSTGSAPYALQGKSVSGSVIGYAVSPDRTKMFMLLDQGGAGVGYVSSFNGKNLTQIFSTPLTELNVAWPADGIIALTTKGSASYNGYLYFVDPKAGTWKRALGPLPGLSASVSRTGKYVLYSTANSQGVYTGIYSVASGTSTDAIIRTLADKCAWGNTYRDLVYCGVPVQLPSGTYPNDWYLGTVSTVDGVWQINAANGEVHLISSIIDQSNRPVDTSGLSTDAKDHYLFFMNKNDLSLWSLDLSAAATK